jgi:hypothetical protein
LRLEERRESTAGKSVSGDVLFRHIAPNVVGPSIVVSSFQLAELIILAKKMAAWLANFGPHGHSRYEFIVDYTDLAGTNYRATFKVDRGHTELLR